VIPAEGHSAAAVGALTTAAGLAPAATGAQAAAAPRPAQAAPVVPVGCEDNVVSWPSAEPALDYTAESLLAFALAARTRAGAGHGA